MKMPLFTSDNSALIRVLRVKKGWGMLRMMNEFPARQQKRSTLNHLIKRIDETGRADRNRGTGRPRSVHTSDNVAVVDFSCSKEGQPGLSKSSREISHETGI